MKKLQVNDYILVAHRKNDYKIIIITKNIITTSSIEFHGKDINTKKTYQIFLMLPSDQRCWTAVEYIRHLNNIEIEEIEDIYREQQRLEHELKECVTRAMKHD